MTIHSVVLCSRNRPQELASVLAQVCRILPTDGQVVVVEASDEGLELDADAVASLGRVVTLSTCRPGLTRQRNHALTLLAPATDIVHFLDDDIVIEDDYFVELERAFDRLPEAVGIGVRTTDNVEYRATPLQRFFLLDSARSGRLLKSGINVGFKTPEATYAVDWLPGCAMAFRWDLVADMRFDEKRVGVGWGEDVDFSVKAANRGQLFITSDTHVVHLRSPINRDTDGVRDRESFRSRLFLAEDFPDRVSKAAVMWSVIGVSVISSGRSLKARTHGIWGALRSVARALVLLLRSVVNWIRSLAKVVISPLRGVRAYRDMCHQVNPPGDRDHQAGIAPPAPVTVILQGGLGNQLFGLATGLPQARRIGTDLVLDPVNFDQANPRSFELEWLVGEDIRVGRAHRGHVLKEATFAFDPRVMDLSAGTVLDGYFQSWRYFDKISDQLRAFILERASQLAPDPACVPAAPFIGVQVRRGDYLNSQALAVHGLCTLEYYRRGLEVCRRMVGPLPAIVFSDDSRAAVEVAQGLHDAHADDAAPDEHSAAAMFRLSQASALVISNSSFGWWAAWLAGPNAPVVAPRPWFTDRTLDVTDLLPPQWLTIDRGA